MDDVEIGGEGWADWCSSLVLDIHQEFDALLSSADNVSPIFYPAPEQLALTEMEAQLRSLNESGYLCVASVWSRVGATSENA